MTFDELRMANVGRSEQHYHPVGGIKEWSPTDWAAAMAGECGEACNVVKKLRRIAETPEALLGLQPALGAGWHAAVYEYERLRREAALELADVVLYADLVAVRLGIDLAAAVVEKFNQTSAEVGSKHYLPPAGPFIYMETNPDEAGNRKGSERRQGDH